MARQQRKALVNDKEPPDIVVVNGDTAHSGTSYFTIEEYEVILKQFNFQLVKSRTNLKENRNKNDVSSFLRLTKDNHCQLLTEHVYGTPLGSSPRIAERIDKFLTCHVGKTSAKPFKELIDQYNSKVSHDLQVNIPKRTNLEGILRILLTQIPMVPLPTVSHICSGHMDSLVLLDRDDFYTCEMKNNALVFHRDPEHRLDALRRCLDGIVELFTPKSHPAEIIPKIQDIILKELKVPLPWDPQKVIAAVADDPESNSAYVQVYLCPLRNHIGKSPGSRTGELLSKVEEQFFSSNLVC